MKNETAEYLGDSVYAEFDGFDVVLYLDNGGIGRQGRHNEITIDPSVCETLISYIARRLPNGRELCQKEGSKK